MTPAPSRYFDTSAVVAYYVPEPLSDRVQEIYQAETWPAISDLVELELISALSLRLRVGDLERGQVDQVARLFLSHLEGGLYRRLHLHDGHYRRARELIARFDQPLKAPDALHLGVCAAEGLRLLTADRQLARTAGAFQIDCDLVQA